MTPRKISRGEDRRLVIEWDDGSVRYYRPAVLRRNCPCATCTTDARNRSAGYIPLYTADALTLKDIRPVGYYALQLVWGDGHETGIYRFDYLRELGEST